MKTIADLKRALVVGAVVQIDNLRHPALSGQRTVLKAQTRSWSLTFPEGHPKAGGTEGSWLDVPKRDQVTFDGATATFVDSVRGEWLRLTVVPAPGPR